jgi:hypothetical protein
VAANLFIQTMSAKRSGLQHVKYGSRAAGDVLFASLRLDRTHHGPVLCSSGEGHQGSELPSAAQLKDGRGHDLLGPPAARVALAAATSAATAVRLHR